jgi:hypothetical protein
VEFGIVEVFAFAFVVFLFFFLQVEERTSRMGGDDSPLASKTPHQRLVLGKWISGDGFL